MPVKNKIQSVYFAVEREDNLHSYFVTIKKNLGQVIAGDFKSCD